jgi:hypothetical protein
MGTFPVATSPRRRIRDPQLLALLAVEYDACEVTGATAIVSGGLHLHHVVFRSHGGDDVRANIVGLSNELHDRYHRGDVLAKLRLAEHILHKRPDTLSYMALKLGAGPRDYWFERHGIPWEDLQRGR